MTTLHCAKASRFVPRACVRSSVFILVTFLLWMTAQMRAQTAQLPQQSQPSAQATVVSGLVSESGSGEAVIGVNVVLAADSLGKTLVRGARTNKFGFYSLPNVPQGTYFLKVSGLGYRPVVRRCVLTSEPAKINIQLQTDAVKGQEVVVQSNRQESAVANTQSISTIAISPETLKKIPALGGEVDVFRALQLTPGVKSGVQGTSGLYVRGGSPDQNLVLLDGVSIYNPTHLGGLLSVFNNDALADTRLIKGAFPAEYGGRLSSVVDISMREGTKEKLSGTAGLNFINSRLTLEGPLGDKASFMLSGRRMYLDLIRAVLPDSLRRQIPGYFFYDFNVKVNYQLSENDRLFLSGYAGYDVFQQPENLRARFDVNWGNTSVNARWMHIVSPSLFTNFSAMFTNYDFSTAISDTNARGEIQAFSSLARIRDWTLRGEAQWFALAGHTVKAGFEAILHQFRSQVDANAQFGAGGFQLDQSGGSTVESLEGAAFVQDEWEDALGIAGLTANIGTRLVYFQRGGYVFGEPRASLSYQVNEDLTLRGAFAVANQFVHLIIRNNIGVPSDVWFPATETVLPARGVQYVLGGETMLFEREWSLGVEGYYKTFANLYEFKDDAQFSLLAPIEGQLTRGTGESYGAEVFLQKRMGNLTGWLGYTLSWAWRTFADLNEGRPFHPRFDTRHELAVVASYKLDDAWELGATWNYATGQAFTMAAAQFDFAPLTSGTSLPTGTPRPKFQSTDRNAFRLPAFHKLDVSLTHYFTWFGLPFNASLSIYNAYNRQNPFTWSINYRTETLPNGSVVRTPFVQQLSLFPIIPTVGIGFKF